jgi:hypothetical protein
MLAVWSSFVLITTGIPAWAVTGPLDDAGQSPRAGAHKLSRQIAVAAAEKQTPRAGRAEALRLRRGLPDRFRAKARISRVVAQRFSVRVAGRSTCAHWVARGKVDVTRGDCFRNARKHPFASTSIWNTSIGTGAQYVDAGLSPMPRGDEWASMPIADYEHIVMRPNARSTPVLYSPGAWGGDRCSATSTRLATVPMPRNYVVPSSGRNGSAAFLLADGRTVLQTQPLARCDRGAAATSYVTFPGVDIYGPGQTGSHGGSGLSALGGSLRVGELRPRKHPPRHALKVIVDAATELYPCATRSTCYRWPATKSDSYAAGYYGSEDRSAPSALTMGALLALRQDLDLSSIGHETVAAKKLAWTLQNYGAYIVDDSYGASFGFAVEDGPAGSFADQFARDYGTSFEARVAEGTPWTRDVQRLVDLLAVVSNNGPRSVGGGGKPLQRPLPPVR